MHVVVTYESRTGNTATAAKHVAKRLDKAGAEVSLFAVDEPDYGALATYAHNAGKAADKLGEVLEAMGSVNLGVSTIHRNKIEEEAAEFVDSILRELAAA